MTSGIIIKNEELTSEQEEDEALKLCEPCELGKAMRYVRKRTEPRYLEAFTEAHVDVLMVTPTGYKGIKYATVITDKWSTVRWVYFHKEKNGAFDALMQHQKLVQTQFGKTIKLWRLDGGKEYIPSKHDEVLRSRE